MAKKKTGKKASAKKVAGARKAVAAKAKTVKRGKKQAPKKKSSTKSAGARTAKAVAKKRPAARKASTGKAAPRAAAPKISANRPSWLDEAAQKPVIERYARQLTSFMEAMADGVIEAGELRDQENRLVRLMKEIEPQLDDGLHAQVTRLLCELTAYDLMQVLHAMHEARPKVEFQG